MKGGSIAFEATFHSYSHGHQHNDGQATDSGACASSDEVAEVHGWCDFAAASNSSAGDHGASARRTAVQLRVQVAKDVKHSNRFVAPQAGILVLQWDNRESAWSSRRLLSTLSVKQHQHAAVATASQSGGAQVSTGGRSYIGPPCTIHRPRLGSLRALGLHKLAGNFDAGGSAVDLGSAAQALVASCFKGLQPSRVIDYHTHITGVGANGTGCYINPAMTGAVHIVFIPHACWRALAVDFVTGTPKPDSCAFCLMYRLHCSSTYCQTRYATPSTMANSKPS